MSPENRRFARYVLPPFYGVALLIGVLVHQFVIIAIAGAIVFGVLWTAVARGGGGPGRDRGRQRNRNRNRS
jgi:hypothetical protein